MRAMAGLGPCRGELLLEGENLLTQPFSRRAEQVVYLPQTLPAGLVIEIEIVFPAFHADQDLPDQRQLFQMI